MSYESFPLSNQSLKNQRNVLVIVGATASGKTPVSLLIAKRINGEILSADSRQIYRMMDIGTAKPTSDELKSIPHHFIDELLPDQNFNAGEFGKQGRQIIDEIFSKGKIPLVVGGSGLYIRALIDGFFDGPSANSLIREELYYRLEVEGAEILLEELRQIDPVSASRMIPTNERRIVRALEVFRTTGAPISEMHKSKIEINFNPVFVGLNWDRKKLYERINKRVDSMMKTGLIDEVKQLRLKGYSSTLNALQTVGYKEVFDHLDNKIDYNRMVELIKQNSRRYAKRQLTWFRHDDRIKWFNINHDEEFEKIGLEITEYFIKSDIV